MAIFIPSSSESKSTSTSTQTSGPYDPSFFGTAKAQVQEQVALAKAAKDAQLARLDAYIKHMYALREISRQAAKGTAQRAGGMQNPVAMYQSVIDLANRASVPIDAEINKVLQQSNSIENTLSSILGQAEEVYTKLAGIPSSKGESKSESFQTSTGGGAIGGGGGGGGGGAYAGGSRRGGAEDFAPPGGGGYTDIHGKYWPQRPGQAMVELGSGVNRAEQQRMMNMQNKMKMMGLEQQARKAGMQSPLSDFSQFQARQAMESAALYGPSGEGLGGKMPYLPGLGSFTTAKGEKEFPEQEEWWGVMRNIPRRYDLDTSSMNLMSRSTPGLSSGLTAPTEFSPTFETPAWNQPQNLNYNSPVSMSELDFGGYDFSPGQSTWQTEGVKDSATLYQQNPEEWKRIYAPQSLQEQEVRNYIDNNTGFGLGDYDPWGQEPNLNQPNWNDPSELSFSILNSKSKGAGEFAFDTFNNPLYDYDKGEMRNIF